MFRTFLFRTLFILSLFSIISIPTQAQTPQEALDAIQTAIELQSTPQFPRAGDTVSLRLVSYSNDLDRATIIWRINNTIVSQGIGVKSYQFTTGALGTRTNVSVTIRTVEGPTVERRLTIRPADIDILWQATAYTPPLYKGKALYPHQGLITFYALPSFGNTTSLTEAKNYVFTWKKDGEVFGDFSGYGRNTFSIRGAVISRAFTVSVDVVDMQGNLVGTGSVDIKPQQPEVLLYEDSPIYGPIFNRNLSSITLQDLEVTLLSVPYFINIFPEENILTYTWSLNNTKIPEQEDPKKLVLRAQGTEPGKATISVKVQNTAKILQFANTSVVVNFNGN